MGNQQETTAYVAGLFEGEGSLLLTKINAKALRKPSYRCQIQFVNTEPELIQTLASFFRKHDIKYHIRTDIRKKRSKVCYQLSITTQESKLRFLDLIERYMQGNRKELVPLCRRFVEHMRNRVRPKDEKTGRYLAQSQDDLEELYQEYKKLVGSSETKRQIPVMFG